MMRGRGGEYGNDHVDASSLPNFNHYDDGFDRFGEGGNGDNKQAVQDVPSYLLPDEVKDFVVYFRRQISAQNTFEIQACYEGHFKKLTDQYFKDEPWPTADMIARLVDDDALFLTLYRELYFRHIYQKMAPTIEQRFESYENYCDLFNYILDAQTPVALELPNKWLWDIVDEFIYQFQSFAQYRAKFEGKSEEEMALLRGNPQIWNVHIVLNVLHSLVEKSRINEQLAEYRKGDNPQEVAGEFGSRTLYKMLGYFSLVGLLRLHVLLGDYHLALKVTANIELNKKGLYSRVPACQITIYYYVGFCYLMMRRYQDTVRCFANILYYIQRTQSFHTRSSGYDMLVKKRDQLYNLLAIAMTLSPQRIDDSVQQELVTKCGERMQKMHKGDQDAVDELFQYGCPKFVSPVAPDYDAPDNEEVHMPYKTQLKMFKREVQQQSMLPTIRSYLKLYSSLSIEKLAAFLAIDETSFRVQLHNYKHKTNQLVWTAGTASAGHRMSADDVDFYVDKDMVHIANIKVARCYGEYFVHHINKMATGEKDGGEKGQQQ